MTAAATKTARFLTPSDRGTGGTACGETGDTCPTASASFVNAAGIPNFGTSIHCEFDKKYSSSGFNAAASTRNGMIGLRFEAARSTSLATCDDPTALPDITSTTAFASLIARTMASAYCAPGFTSRGAIQHLSPCCSRFSTMELATAASCDA